MINKQKIISAVETIKKGKEDMKYHKNYSSLDIVKYIKHSRLDCSILSSPKNKKLVG